MSRARGWVLECEGVRYGVLAPSAAAALQLAREVGFAESSLATRGALPAEHARELRASRGTVLLELKTLAERALSRGVALRRFRAQSSSRSQHQPTSKERTMKTKAKGKQGKSAKGNGAARADQQFSVSKKSTYAVREGTMSDKFLASLPKGRFTKAAAVSATQKAVKTEKRAGLFFNYFKGKGVLVAA